MLMNLSLPTIFLLTILGILLDSLFAEVPRFHPLVGFGRYANWLEARLNRYAKATPTAQFIRGWLAWVLAVLPPVALCWYCRTLLPNSVAWLLDALMLYFCLGMTSLKQHTLPIGLALQAGQLAEARHLTSRIVSRDTENASEADLSRAAVESILENGNDAIFATLFWFVLGAGPLVLLFRLSNTLDAMWGYRNQRFDDFGCFAARCDDALNLLPARLTAMTYLLLAPGIAGKQRVWACWRSQSPLWSSPNAGPVMASGAASLSLSLGGPASYDGEIEQRPALGHGRTAQASDIARAWQLVARSVGVWLLGLGLMSLIAMLPLVH